MAYKREEIISKCKAALLDPRTFYKAALINYRGVTSDTKELYTEIIAEFLLNNLKAFIIPTISRISSYRTAGHNGEYNDKTNREEEVIAMNIFKQGELNLVGKIIDYQTPLKNTSGDIAGKIDILAYDGNTLQILELKKPDSKETMIRCVLEGYTYLKTADGPKLLRDFELPAETSITARPLVFKGGAQYREWQEQRPMLKQLTKELNCYPLFITEAQCKYYISEEN